MSTTEQAPARTTHSDPGRSRMTAIARLVLAVWLMADGLITLARSPSVVDPTGTVLGTLLRLAALHFTLGIFLLTGFMSRVGGVVLVALGIWQTTQLGAQPLEVAMVLIGTYMALRGGGTWAMDVYVEKMQDRVRQRQAREAEERRRASPAE